MEDPGRSPTRPARSPPWAAVLLVFGAIALIGHEALFVEHVESPSKRSARRYRSIRSRTRAHRIHPPPRPAESRTVPKAEPADHPQVPLAPEATTPPAQPEEPCDPDALVLTRIVYDPTEAEATFAVIDDRAVRAGETVGGWRVFRVEKDRVLLGPEGQTILLLMER